jgi:hypothetical protein
LRSESVNMALSFNIIVDTFKSKFISCTFEKQ